jgi:hypothetical protein
MSVLVLDRDSIEELQELRQGQWKEKADMTTKKKTTTGKGSARKLKLNKETLKDLSERSKVV